MKLTDIQIKAIKSTEKTIRLWDGEGLYLEIRPPCSKGWRFKYRFNGKEKRISLGAYPKVSLKEARKRLEEAKRVLADDKDPSAERQSRKRVKAFNAANTFEKVARQWWETQSPGWKDRHADDVLHNFEVDIFPFIGQRPIGDIDAPELLAVLQRVVDRGAVETARRELGNCRRVFGYALATGRANRNPGADLEGVLPPKPKTKHFAAFTKPEDVGRLVKLIDEYWGTFVVCSAFKLAPLFFVRPGELRSAKWAEIDFEAREWQYLSTKTNIDHIVPLANQAITILQALQRVTGHGIYLFPNARDKQRPMSSGSITAALRAIGITKEEHTWHGFRAMGRTILTEVCHYPPEVVELQLTHCVRDPMGRAYNRTTFLPERKKMMQSWADYLDKLKGEV
ncbi:integrase arm-type DNA-binding domain-containing protein [Candidatus Synechococcus calcipolaris G9]|uniref:Integrase arm-type DNA-binding domain-containing protein n=1 Tax=Candidatus Synechococcus calcipolaris G9 TaxID=1497997 RepID=A0ABT6EYY7_9SYNE|nr:integrase arm-type DNA-binding domain-containing protein [Candidatus Synechococcus calcipolaris]MDG2990513.1 integrase arm-type DNA-binding domain-containing protein [Candidatus Synechococcus calcipolaris G9]